MPAPRAAKSRAWGAADRKHSSKNGYLSLSPQPNEARSGRAAVRIKRSGLCKGGMKTPEKQAEITTTLGRAGQASFSIAASR